jgi:surface carbohydrate biosynthesis protein
LPPGARPVDKALHAPSGAADAGEAPEQEFSGMAAGRTLLLPVETLAREFDGKLLLALIAAERNWTVILGEQTVLRERLSTMPPGTFLSKSARGTNAQHFDHMRRLGHHVAVLDEEALVRQTDDIYVMKHEKGALDHVDLLMTWGEENADLWRESGLFDPARIAVTGNPRVDMLRPELRPYHQAEIDAIHGRYGDYVLFNSNFAMVNHFIAGKSRFTLASWVPDQDRQAQTSAILDHKRALFDRFRTLLPKVARAIAPVKLVVRPHPSESHQAWEEALEGEPNAVVVFEGSVVPWIAGARAMIHNGCTTAVEGAVVGITSLCYRPVTSDGFDNPLPNSLSIECTDDDGLIETLLEVLRAGSHPLDRRQQATLDHFISSRSGPLASERMMDALESRRSLLTGARRPSPADRVRVFALHRLASLRRATAFLSASGRSRDAYRNRKFPAMTLDFVQSRARRLEAALGRFQSFRIRQTGPNLFTIHS